MIISSVITEIRITATSAAKTVVTKPIQLSVEGNIVLTHVLAHGVGTAQWSTVARSTAIADPNRSAVAKVTIAWIGSVGEGPKS